jgi:hypothetical protein
LIGSPVNCVMPYGSWFVEVVLTDVEKKTGQLSIGDELLPSAPEPQHENRTNRCEDVVHQWRGQQPQEHADVEADECAGNANERTGNIAARGATKTREPAPRISVEGQAGDNADDQNDQQICECRAANGHVRIPPQAKSQLETSVASLRFPEIVTNGGAPTLVDHLMMPRWMLRSLCRSR